MGRVKKWAVGLMGLAAVLFWGCAPAAPAATTQTTAPATEATLATVAEGREKDIPQPVEYILTFAGDCTLGTEHNVYGNSGSFVRLVGDDYGYPFENVLTYFENDEFTLVNLEGTFTAYNVPQEKRFRFRAPMEYAKILTEGSVEAVTLANNHSFDYGQTGYDDTKTALENEGVAYVEDAGTTLLTTENGLKVGLYAAQFDLQVDTMEAGIESLRAQGAELVIVSLHFGVEGSYRPTDQQKTHARAAIDAGADIVCGHHPHVLQPVEAYNGGIIFYSLGNFSFGGNRNPRDKDSVVIRQTVIRERDGSVHLGETERIPVCISSVSGKNDYKPTPYEEGSKAYLRALSKLDGTFTGKDLVVSYADKDTSSTGEETPVETTGSEQTQEPEQTPTQASEPEQTPQTEPETTPDTQPEQTPEPSEAPAEQQTQPAG